ncbi:RNA polymerase sigma factor [Actinomycetospora chibensis]|uniref:Sigma-70 family RNA polymerase sigma factor n=1 Tax=Actinomycetospora chibensis TaxID=663606 RepID=A0ABV9RDQ7_9PSEU|nr:sigma-70 family RNA polymerase sigma factor [Actinomycetospora chibensis]MDD7926372.1 sigma-70 family RNA polymerase sigma factor [Actinomycetospora chibensis]
MRVSDASLAAAAPTSSTAFAAIYRRYGDALHDFCLGMLRDPDAAADCVQDVFCTAATRLGQLREHDKLRSWLYAIARHEALARLRGRRREEVADELPDRPSPEHSLDTLAARRELADLVARAAGGLSDRDRTLLELHYRHGLDGPELADALGVSATNANTLVSRLRSTIERCLGALLVARHEREACAELGDLLGNWDGTMTVLLRKRVNRHVERCSRCGEARRRLLSPTALLASAPVAVPAPGWLSDSVARQAAPTLHRTSETTATGTSWWPAGLGGGTHTSATVLAPFVAAVVAVPAVAVAMLTGEGATLSSNVGPGALVPSTSAVPPIQGVTPTSATSSPTPSTSAGPVPTSRLVPGAPGAPSGGARPGARPGQPAVPVPTAPLGPFRRTPVAPAPAEPTRVDPPETRPTTGSGCVACSATTAPSETP